MNPSAASPTRLGVALATALGWMLLTVFGMRWASDGSNRPLVEILSQGIHWNLVMAIALLAVVSLAMRWRDLKFVAPRPTASMRVLAFPALYLALFAVLAAMGSPPPATTVMWVLLNTLLVGLSEEWMFRGVLFQGLRSRLPMWPAMLLTSVAFGSVHLMNVFVTGQLFDAMVQSLTAFMSGMLLVALLVRTGSIWVPIVYHALWDFGTFMVAAGSRSSGPATDLSQGWNWALPLALVLPNFICALLLLRGVRNDTRLATD